MASIISAGTTSGTALNMAGDTSGVLQLATNGSTTAMTISTAQNVGIGTSSPTEKLHVSGTSSTAALLETVAASSDNVQLRFKGVSGERWAIGNNIAAGGTGLNFDIYDLANTANRMRIDSSGNVLVGTTSVRGKFNNVAASSQGSGYNAFFQNTWAGDVSVAGLYVAKFDNNSTTSQQFVRFSINNDATGSGQINANGASAAAFGSFSDKRLKENITDLPSQLNNIMALRPVEFDYIASEGGGHQIGFIAQEVKEIYPDLIGEREDGMFTLTDMNKNDARLIKAIQEQQTIINDLKARITALEGVA